ADPAASSGTLAAAVPRAVGQEPDGDNGRTGGEEQTQGQLVVHTRSLSSALSRARACALRPAPCADCGTRADGAHGELSPGGSRTPWWMLSGLTAHEGEEP